MSTKKNYLISQKKAKTTKATTLNGNRNEQGTHTCYKEWRSQTDLTPYQW